MYSPDKPFKVYEQSVWRSDQRNPLDYGREYDFNKTFSENFQSLMQVVPLVALSNLESENSEYCNW